MNMDGISLMMGKESSRLHPPRMQDLRMAISNRDCILVLKMAQDYAVDWIGLREDLIQSRNLSLMKLGYNQCSSKKRQHQFLHDVLSTGMTPLQMGSSVGFLDWITWMGTQGVNLNDPKGDRYVKVTLRLTVTPAEIVEKMSKDEIFMARARDRILTVLSAKTAQDVGSPIGKETLRREILARVSPLVAGGKLEDVLFSDFVVQ